MDPSQDINTTANGSQLTKAHLAVEVNDTSASTPEPEMDPSKALNSNWHTGREAFVSIAKELPSSEGVRPRRCTIGRESSQVPTEEEDEDREPDIEDSVTNPTVLMTRQLQSEGAHLQQWYGVSPETIGAIDPIQYPTIIKVLDVVRTATKNNQLLNFNQAFFGQEMIPHILETNICRKPSPTACYALLEALSSTKDEDEELYTKIFQGLTLRPARFSETNRRIILDASILYLGEVNPLRDPLDEDDCLKNWKTLIDGCGTDTTTRKRGGTLRTKDGSWWDLRMKQPSAITKEYCNSDHVSKTLTSVSREFAAAQIKSLCSHNYDQPAYKDVPRWYRVSGILDRTIELDLKYADDQTNCQSTSGTPSF